MDTICHLRLGSSMNLCSRRGTFLTPMHWQSSKKHNYFLIISKEMELRKWKRRCVSEMELYFQMGYVYFTPSRAHRLRDLQHDKYISTLWYIYNNTHFEIPLVKCYILFQSHCIMWKESVTAYNMVISRLRDSLIEEIFHWKFVTVLRTVRWWHVPKLYAMQVIYRPLRKIPPHQGRRCLWSTCLGKIFGEAAC